MKLLLASLSLILSVLLSTGCNSPKKTQITCKDDLCWENLINEHLKRYPLLQIEDLYKLLYQSTLGNGHAITDSAQVARWLSHDLMNLQESSSEQLADTLGSCGRFARVHIKAFIQYGGDPSELLKAFMVTGHSYPPDSTAFFCALSTARDMAEKGKLPWNDDSLDSFIDQQATLHYPAIHHSDRYDSAYHPAYRVIARELLPDLFKRSGNKVADLNPSTMASVDHDKKRQSVLHPTKKSDS